MNLKENLHRRDLLVKQHKPDNVKYFDIQEYLNFDLYSTYIFITPRNIGKTYSGFKLVKEVYEATGEYTVWMRSTDVELKEIVKDFGETRYEFWPEDWKLTGNSVIDNKTGNLVLKFISLSTSHNFASIKGAGCFGIIYDEFLPRTSRSQPSYKALTDFIKTLERDKLLTVILMANATTLNSEILNNFDLWKDCDEQSDEIRRVYYRRIREWADAPDTKEISTAYNWAISSEEMLDYMFSSDFLKNDDNSVVPLSRLDVQQWIQAYRLNGEVISVGINEDTRYVIAPGRRDEDLLVYNLTRQDNFTPSDAVSSYGVEGQLNYLFHALNIGNVVFTDYGTRDAFFKFVLKYLPTKL